MGKKQIGTEVHRSTFFYLNYISTSSLWCQDKDRRWVPPLNTQCLQNSDKSGKRSVLTLCSLSLPVVGGIQREADFYFFKLYCSLYLFQRTNVKFKSPKLYSKSNIYHFLWIINMFKVRHKRDASFIAKTYSNAISYFCIKLQVSLFV